MNSTEFYQETADPGFRFGDIIKGFVSATPIDSNNTDYSIKISTVFCVIISPCCSISDEVLSLIPLLPIKNSFLNNPYFQEDLTRINRLVPPEKALPPKAFEHMPTDKKTEMINKGPSYTFVDLFIYKEHDVFPEYIVNHKTIRGFKTKYYMIDFRNTFSVNCSKIKNPQTVPEGIKYLQLSIDARAELRDKITHYYGRPPIEDIRD